MHAIIVWLKTASYAFTNRDLRHAYLHPVQGELDALPPIYQQRPYPTNITIDNLVYFWWAPTLVYQPVYPRNASIRWIFVFKRLGEVVCLSVFIWFASAQYATPVLRNSLDKIASLDYPSILERLLKLSTISLVIWLAGFFALFQSFLNALAEVTRFADRSFYDEWCTYPLFLSFPPPPNQKVLTKTRELGIPRHLLAHLEQARLPILPPPRLLPDAVTRVVAPHRERHRVSPLGHPARALRRRAHAQPDRRRVPGNVSAAAADPADGAAGADAVAAREVTGEHHFLGVVYHLGPAVCGAHVLLCVAGQVWECESVDGGGGGGRGGDLSCCLDGGG